MPEQAQAVLVLPKVEQRRLSSVLGYPDVLTRRVVGRVPHAEEDHPAGTRTQARVAVVLQHGEGSVGH